MCSARGLVRPNSMLVGVPVWHFGSHWYLRFLICKTGIIIPAPTCPFPVLLAVVRTGVNILRL